MFIIAAFHLANKLYKVAQSDSLGQMDKTLYLLIGVELVLTRVTLEPS